jgi:hypothetical protein
MIIAGNEQRFAPPAPPHANMLTHFQSGFTLLQRAYASTGANKSKVGRFVDNRIIDRWNDVQWLRAACG